MATVDDYQRAARRGRLTPALAALAGEADRAALRRAIETGDHKVRLSSAGITALNTALGGTARTADQIHQSNRRRNTK